MKYCKRYKYFLRIKENIRTVTIEVIKIRVLGTESQAPDHLLLGQPDIHCFILST